ncbi:hypothetical protein JXJ21_14010 [candidate division KSB1 bacterium]|nr:hypothetical protein [candidate division KSB1 bacterium]
MNKIHSSHTAAKTILFLGIVFIFLLMGIGSFNIFSQELEIDPSRTLTIGKLSGKLDYREPTYPYMSTEIPLSDAEKLGVLRILRSSSEEILSQLNWLATNHDRHPRFIKYRFFDSEWELIAAIITEKIDFAKLESEASAREIHKSNHKIHVLSNLFPDHTVTLVAYNCRHAILREKAIRRALTAAIDRAGFIYKVLEERAEPARGPYSSGFWAFENSLDALKYNPKKALEWLHENGWSDYDDDGILENYTGKSFKLNLIYGRGLVLDEILVRWIKVNWNEIGIDVKPVPMKKSEIEQRLKQRNFDAILMTHQFSDSLESLESFFSIKGKNNFMGYYSRQIERGIEFHKQISDVSRRKTLLQSIQRVINEDQPASFLYFKMLYYNFVNTNRIAIYFDENGDLLPFEQWILKNDATTKD